MSLTFEKRTDFNDTKGTETTGKKGRPVSNIHSQLMAQRHLHRRFNHQEEPLVSGKGKEKARANTAATISSSSSRDNSENVASQAQQPSSSRQSDRKVESGTNGAWVPPPSYIRLYADPYAPLAPQHPSTYLANGIHGSIAIRKMLDEAAARRKAEQEALLAALDPPIEPSSSKQQATSHGRSKASTSSSRRNPESSGSQSLPHRSNHTAKSSRTSMVSQTASTASKASVSSSPSRRKYMQNESHALPPEIHNKTPVKPRIPQIIPWRSRRRARLAVGVGLPTVAIHVVNVMVLWPQEGAVHPDVLATPAAEAGADRVLELMNDRKWRIVECLERAKRPPIPVKEGWWIKVGRYGGWGWFSREQDKATGT